MIVAMIVVMAVRRVQLRRENVCSGLNGFLRTHGAHMVGAAVQAFHLTQASQPWREIIRRGPFDADFFAAAGAWGGRRKQGLRFAHGFSLAVRRCK